MTAPLAGPSQAISLSPKLAQRLTLVPDSLVTARVERIDGQRATLLINGQSISARTDIPLQPGRHYTFQVIFHNGQWQLRPLPAEAAGLAASRHPTAPVLPPQQAIAQLASLIGRAETGTLPELAPLLNTIGRLLLRDPKELTPQRIRQQIENSGVLFESRLRKGEPIDRDMKAQLLRLLEKLPDSSKDKSAVEAVVRHIQQHQLNSLDGSWLGFPLLFAPQSPVCYAQIWLRQPDPDWQETAPWQALLQLDLRYSGLLEVLIRLDTTRDNRVELTFWTPNETLENRIHQATDTLIAQFADQDVLIDFSEMPLANRVQPSRQLRVRA